MIQHVLGEFLCFISHSKHTKLDEMIQGRKQRRTMNKMKGNKEMQKVKCKKKTKNKEREKARQKRQRCEEKHEET